MSETAVVVLPKPTSTLDKVKAALNKVRMEVYVASLFAFLFLSATAVGAQTDPDPIVRPTLELDVDTMLYYMFEGANIIIVALGAVVFLTIGFVLGRKILDLIRQAISSL
jgi:hypothetical protein